MQIPGAWVETLRPPETYTHTQLDLACAVAHAMRRGKFILVTPPARTG